MRYDLAPRYGQDYEAAGFFDGYYATQREPQRRRIDMHDDSRNRVDALGMDHTNPQCKFYHNELMS